MDFTRRPDGHHTGACLDLAWRKRAAQFVNEPQLIQARSRPRPVTPAAGTLWAAEETVRLSNGSDHEVGAGMSDLPVVGAVNRINVSRTESAFGASLVRAITGE